MLSDSMETILSPDFKQLQQVMQHPLVLMGVIFTIRHM